MKTVSRNMRCVTMEIYNLKVLPRCTKYGSLATSYTNDDESGGTVDALFTIASGGRGISGGSGTRGGLDKQRELVVC